MDEDTVSYCERFLELMTDLVAQLPTRRFFNTLMDSSHLIVSCYGYKMQAVVRLCVIL